MSGIDVIKKIIKSKIDSMNVIINNAQQFIDEAGSAIQGHNKEDYQAVLDAIQLLKGTIEMFGDNAWEEALRRAQIVVTNKAVEVTKSQKSKALALEQIKQTSEPEAEDRINMIQRISLMFDHFDKMFEGVNRIVGVINNPTYLKIISYNNSQTFTQKISGLVTSIIDEQNRLIEDQPEVNSFILNFIKINLFINNIIPMAAANIIVDYILSELSRRKGDTGDSSGSQKYAVPNQLEIFLLNVLLRVCSKERSEKILDVIELLKDSVLNSTHRIFRPAGKPTSFKLRYDSVQSMLTRYGLVPITDVMPVKDLFADIKIKYDMNKHPEDNIRTLPCVVIKKLSGTPIMFDIRPLVDIKYVAVNDLRTDPINGLNKKIIQRFSTVKLYPRKGKIIDDINQTGTQIYAVLPPNISAVYVFETVDNYNYRLLSNTGEMLVEFSSIEGILNGAYSRALHYNKNVLDDAFEKCHDPHMDEIIDQYKKSASSSASVIISGALDPIMEKITAEANISNIKSEKDAKDLLAIKTDQIVDIILTKIQGDSNSSSEYMLTKLVRMSDFAKDFKRSLTENYEDLKLPEVMFKQYSAAEVRNQIINAIRIVITKTLNDISKSAIMADYDKSLKEFVLEKKYM